MSDGESAVIGGEETDDRYAAIGALMMDGSSFCTATLVATRWVVTARHCMPVPEGDGEDEGEGELAPLSPVFFQLGRDVTRAPDPSKREHRVEVVRWVEPADPPDLETNPHNPGTALPDVLLGELAEPVRDVEPIRLSLRPLATSEVGHVFQAVGFGDDSEAAGGGSSGKRRVVDLELMPLDANALRVRYGTMEAFERALADIEQRPVETHEGRIVDSGRFDAWGEFVRGYEAYLWPKRGRTCNGDSGGPLLRAVGERFEIVGVVSRGHRGETTGCLPLGDVFATFANREARDLLSRVR